MDVSPIVVTFQKLPFSTSMIMGGRVVRVGPNGEQNLLSLYERVI